LADALMIHLLSGLEPHDLTIVTGAILAAD